MRSPPHFDMDDVDLAIIAVCIIAIFAVFLVEDAANILVGAITGIVALARGNHHNGG